MKYSQPSFYHFNEDSVALANYVIEQGGSYDLVADICCGSGIIGIEVAQKLMIEKIVFVEKQKDYKSHLEYNQKHFLSAKLIEGMKLENHFDDFLKWGTQESFDLILMNPPYFNSSHFRPSPDDKRNQCRLYSNGELTKIIFKGIESLNIGGKFYFLIRDEASSREEVDSAIKRDKSNSNIQLSTAFQGRGFSALLITKLDK